MISDRFFYSEFASFCRAQLECSFFFSYRKRLDDGRLNRVNFNSYPWRLAVKYAKISSSSMDDSLSAWIGLLDRTRIRTLVNLLYLGIRDNHWNYVNFKILETINCNYFWRYQEHLGKKLKLSSWIKTLELYRTLYPWVRPWIKKADVLLCFVPLT